MIYSRAILMTVLSASLLLIGCRPRQHPNSVSQDNPQSSGMEDREERMEHLEERAAALSKVAQRLPGRDPAADRRLIAEGFDRARAALELLGGTNPDGSFRQQLRIIDNTRSALAAAEDVSPEPAIDSGMRALRNALASVRDRWFQDDQKLAGQLQQLSDRIDELDSVRGPMHSLTVAQCFASASAAVERMSGELSARTAAMSTPPSAPPSTQPAVQ